MSKLEKISILMAAYNAEKTIKYAVESVQVQNCGNVFIADMLKMNDNQNI